jgi:hypothetical protein
MLQNQSDGIRSRNLEMTIKNKITISHKRLPEDESTDSTDTGFTHHDRLVNNEASRNLKMTGIIPENI